MFKDENMFKTCNQHLVRMCVLSLTYLKLFKLASNKHDIAVFFFFFYLLLVLWIHVYCSCTLLLRRVSDTGEHSDSHEGSLSWGRFLFQNSLGGMYPTTIGGAEQGARCIQIIHFGRAESPKWPPLLFPRLYCHGLHPQTLSLAGIISKPLNICAVDIFSGKGALITGILRHF